jgi:hypothetical protein
MPWTLGFLARSFIHRSISLCGPLRFRSFLPCLLARTIARGPGLDGLTSSPRRLPSSDYATPTSEHGRPMYVEGCRLARRLAAPHGAAVAALWPSASPSPRLLPPPRTAAAASTPHTTDALIGSAATIVGPRHAVLPARQPRHRGSSRALPQVLLIPWLLHDAAGTHSRLRARRQKYAPKR